MAIYRAPREPDLRVISLGSAGVHLPKGHSMIRDCIRIALVGWLAFGFLSVACRRTTPVQRNADVTPVVKDTAGVIGPFKEPTLTSAPFPEARRFELQAAGQRDSLRATLRKERALWRANNLRDYWFMLRVRCFCPGVRGWLMMEVRSSKLVRAWDSTGKVVAINAWNTRSIDGLFDNLERTADIDGIVQVAFDPRWHFPAYVSTVVLPGPDRWSIIEALGLRPILTKGAQ
jgi:hypothetical protein